MAIAQRYYEELDDQDAGRYGELGCGGYGAVDLQKLCAIFRNNETVPAQHRMVLFKTIDAGLEPDNLIRTVERDGEWYVELAAFFIFFNWDRNQITVCGRGCNKVIIPNGQTYRAGIDGYQEGYTYIKVSALGFRATLAGATLELE